MLYLSFLPFTSGGLPFDAVWNHSLPARNRYPNFIAPEGHLWYRFYENK